MKLPESQSERDEAARQILEHPLETEDEWRAVARLIDDLEGGNESEQREDT